MGDTDLFFSPSPHPMCSSPLFCSPSSQVGFGPGAALLSLILVLKSCNSHFLRAAALKLAALRGSWPGNFIFSLSPSRSFWFSPDSEKQLLFQSQ